MSTNSQPLDLEGKAESAVIAWLQTSPRLKSRRIVSSAEESAKSNGTISVNAKRGAEVSPNSGVWEINVQVEFSLRIKPKSQSMNDFCAVKAAIAERFEIFWRSLIVELTRMRNDWHCYYVIVQGSNSDPQEGMHHYALDLQLQAMPVTFAQAEAANVLIENRQPFI